MAVLAGPDRERVARYATAQLWGDIMLTVNNDFLLVLSALFSSGWRIFTSFQIPGTNINVPEFIFACMMVVFVIRMVPPILGVLPIFAPPDADQGNSNPRTSQNAGSGSKSSNHKGKGM